MIDDGQVPGNGYGTDVRWTSRSREAFRRTLDDLLTVLREHGERVLAVSGGPNPDAAELVVGNEAVAESVAAFEAALFDLTGTTIEWVDEDEDSFADEDEYEFDEDEEDDEDDEEEEEADEEAAGADVAVAETEAVVAVLRREDYLVTDVATLVRQARSRWRYAGVSRPEEIGEGLHDALTALFTAYGDEDPGDVLDRLRGVVPGWSTVVVAEAAEPLSPDAEDPFSGPTAPLYRLIESPDA